MTIQRFSNLLSTWQVLAPPFQSQQILNGTFHPMYWRKVLHDTCSRLLNCKCHASRQPDEEDDNGSCCDPKQVVGH